MKYRVPITRVETGETRWYEDDAPTWDEDTAHYAWTDGNYACDCNREIFFNRIGGVEPEEDADGGVGFCVGHGRYLVTHLEMEGGERIDIDGR